jgi:hypothetical protein
MAEQAGRRRADIRATIHDEPQGAKSAHRLVLASHKRLPNGVNVAAEISKDERMPERRNAEFATPLATAKAEVPH